MSVASSALVRRLVPNKSAGPGASATPGVLSRICTHGSRIPDSAQPMVSMMAVRASLSARTVMSSGWKAQIFWAKRVASVASPAPFRADGVDLITRPSAVMGFLPSELDSCLRLWRIPAGSRCAHEQGADGRHYTLIGTPPPALAIVPSHSQLARMHWSPRHWPRTHWPQDRGARLGPGQGSAVLRHGINDAAPDRVIEGDLAGGMMHRHSVSRPAPTWRRCGRRYARRW